MLYYAPLIDVVCSRLRLLLQIIGEGNDEGSMIFLPPGIEKTTMISGKRNIHYYDKIKLVINRLEERRDNKEGEILDLFRDDIIRNNDDDNNGDALQAPRPGRRGRGRPRLGLSRRPSKSTKIHYDEDDDEVDTSWKEDGRCLYPKRSSRVGAEYQAEFLPRAGTGTKNETEIEMQQLDDDEPNK